MRVDSVSIKRHGNFYTVYVDGEEVVTLEYLQIDSIFRYARRRVVECWDYAEEHEQYATEELMENSWRELNAIIGAIERKILPLREVG